MFRQNTRNRQGSPVGTTIDGSLAGVSHEAFEHLRHETGALHVQYSVEESQTANISFILLAESAQLCTLHGIRSRILRSEN